MTKGMELVLEPGQTPATCTSPARRLSCRTAGPLCEGVCCAYCQPWGQGREVILGGLEGRIKELMLV